MEYKAYEATGVVTAVVTNDVRRQRNDWRKTVTVNFQLQNDETKEKKKIKNLNNFSLEGVITLSLTPKLKGKIWWNQILCKRRKVKDHIKRLYDALYHHNVHCWQLVKLFN